MSNKVLLLQEIEKVLPEVDKLLLEERNETMTIPASPPGAMGSVSRSCEHTSTSSSIR